MMLARGRTNGTDKPTIIIGLSHENIRRLLDGKPISKDLFKEIGVQAHLFIMAGETEATIARDIAVAATAAGKSVNIQDDAPPSMPDTEV